MAFIKGINKIITIRPEATFGTLPANDSTARVLRRVSGNLVMTRDAIRSQEILSSHQMRDARLGTKRVAGSLSGQLSPGAYKDFFEAMLRKDFVAGATTGALTNVTAAAGPPGTFTRLAGSYITDGFRVGDVVRWTGWATTGAANNARNFRITALSATVMTTTGVGNEVVAAKASGDSVTCTVVGKKTMIPATAGTQLIKSYSVEQWFPDGDTAISERFVGVRIQSMRLSLPSTGLVTMDVQMIGQDMQSDTSQYFSSATAITTDNALIATNGLVRFNGADVAIITGAQLQISCPMDAQPVVGSQIVPDIFPGPVMVDGQLSMYVKDATVFSTFNAETEVDLVWYLTSDSTVNSPFMTLVMNRVKLFSASKTDSDRAIFQSVAFQALEYATATSQYDATTISVQDSSL
jgi:hypothetical protein